MRRPIWLAALGTLGLSATMTACANLPTSGSIPVSSLHGSTNSGQNGVQVVPRAPGRNWSPQDIVWGFLAASASYGYDPNHTARKYLTGGKHSFARRWRPGWQATIIDAPFPKPEQGNPRLNQPSGSQAQFVDLTFKRLTTLVTAGRDQAGTIVVDPPTTTIRFALIQVHGQWRINDIFLDGKPADPSLLLLSSQDFEREYQSRNLYFYPADGDGSPTLVPDPVYLPAQVLNQGLHGLVQTLLQPGLSKNKNWLFGAAETAFPPGTKLLSAQVVGGITAVVNLGGAAAKASPSQQQRMAAQLYWSLAHRQPYPSQEANPISSVVLKINGREVRQQNYKSWVPHAPDRRMYYETPPGPQGSSVTNLAGKPSQTKSVPLPQALAGQPFTAMAVSLEPFGSGVLAGCRGKTVYLMPQSHAGRVITAKLQGAQAPCTSLSWDKYGNLWVGTRMQVYEIRGVGSNPTDHPVATDVLTSQLLPGKSGIQSLQVAPDAVRVAMLISTGAGSKIRIAAISKNRRVYTYIAQTSSVLRVGTDVADPKALTWLDPDHLLVLGRLSSGRNQLFAVPLNGGQSMPIATPLHVTSVTANWPSGNAEPSVAVAIAPTTDGSPGTIQLSRGGWPNPDWQQVAKGTMPVFPG
jgi:Lipoprotein LpqB beta-propeller domain/Sporulation and spore germination